MDLVRAFDEAPGSAVVRARVSALLAEQDLDDTVKPEKLRTLVFAIYLRTLDATLDAAWAEAQGLKTFVFRPETLSDVYVALQALVLRTPDLEPSDDLTRYYQYLFCRLRDVDRDLDLDLLPWAAGVCQGLLRMVPTPRRAPQAGGFEAFVAREKRQLLIRSFREDLAKKAWEFFILPGDLSRGEMGEVGKVSALSCIRKSCPTWITSVETFLLFKTYDEICATFMKNFLHMELTCKHMKNRYDVDFRSKWVCFTYHKHKAHIQKMRVPVIVCLRQKFTVFLFGRPVIKRCDFGGAFCHWLELMRQMKLTMGRVDISDLVI